MSPCLSRVTVVRLALTAGAAAAGLGLATARLAADQSKSAVPARPDDRAIVHVLNRLGYGPRPGDVERVRAMGLQAYIDQQLHPARLADAGMSDRLARLTTVTLSPRELAEEYVLPALQERRERQREAPPPAGPPGGEGVERQQMSEAQQRARQVLADLSEQKILRAVYSERQLEEVLTDFWFNHFNVFAGKGATQIYLAAYERDVIRPHALGTFRDLLGATAESPAMLFYLDNWMSVDPRAAETLTGARQHRVARRPSGGFPPPRGARPGGGDAQAVRRPMGLNENYARELMELHTLGVDGGYTQQDVVEVARCFTGWTIADPRQGGGFRFDPRLHDEGKKNVLGREIDAGGATDGEQVLDILATHPSTATFIATKLARRFVSDDPPASLIRRAARRFRETDGDIRQVVRTIVTSPEFFAPDAYRAKVKTPLEFVASALRATEARVDEARMVALSLRTLGMPLYFAQPPTGYADRADAWVNTGALVGRMNFALALAGSRLRGVSVALAPIVGSEAAPASRFIDVWLGGDVSETTKQAVADGASLAQTAALVLGAPEFQRR